MAERTIRRVVLGSDHRGVELRLSLARRCLAAGLEVADLGPPPGSPAVDYPDQAAAVGRAVAAGRAELGLLVCGTGIGVSIAANKIVGIRAALVAEPHGAALARRHNDANVLCFGAGSVGLELASSCLEAFLAARFEGDRHQRRLDRIAALEGRPGGLGE